MMTEQRRPTRELLKAVTRGTEDCSNGTDLAGDLRRAAKAGHLLGLWSTLTEMNRQSDEPDAHVHSIDEPDQDGETALTLAALNGHSRAVQVRSCPKKALRATAE
jgi:hypothetical protein